MGHENETVGDDYSKLKDDLTFRLEEAEKVGLGFEIPQTPGPIIPVYAKGARDSLTLEKHLLAAGILPPFLKYPGGDANGYFRFVISSGHSRAQLDTLINALKGFQ